MPELMGMLPLVFVHTAAGHYLSFTWPAAEEYGFDPPGIPGQSLTESFTPVDLVGYQQQYRQVLAEARPKELECQFRYNNHYFTVKLLLSPVRSVLQEPPDLVMGLGELIAYSGPYDRRQTISSLKQAGHYRDLLTKITWNIRRKLDLDTIWQQSVEGLGSIFQAEHCFICPYLDEQDAVTVVADYRQGPLPSLVGRALPLSAPYLRHAIASLTPIMQNDVDLEDCTDTLYTVLAIPTCYQDKPNGMIVLAHHPAQHPWNDLSLGLLQDFTDQVGTAIAHASLFRESQDLACELRKVNYDLLQKHGELEDARRQAEETRKQAEEASRLKSEFLANTSHELRTPLNGMIGFLKLILDGMADDPKEQQEFIEEAHKSAIHLLHLINDVLDIAKIEAGKMQIDMGPVKLKELFRDVANFVRPQAEQKGLAFDLLMPVTRDEIILNGNYQRLLQVLLNLVGNAIKFTHEGSVTISAEIKLQKTEFQDKEWPGLIKISVADTGIGVSLEKQDRLFQTFSQVDGERTRQYGGTGLGLAISQKLVEAMGGVVHFISMGEGLGSTVTFTTLLYQEPVVAAGESVTSIE